MKLKSLTVIKCTDVLSVIYTLTSKTTVSLPTRSISSTAGQSMLKRTALNEFCPMSDFFQSPNSNLKSHNEVHQPIWDAYLPNVWRHTQLGSSLGMLIALTRGVKDQLFFNMASFALGKTLFLVVFIVLPKCRNRYSRYITQQS